MTPSVYIVLIGFNARESSGIISKETVYDGVKIYVEAKMKESSL
jgi:hypothetical protein